MPVVTTPLHLEAPAFLKLFRQLGPSLALWRAAEVAALRQQDYAHPVLDVGCGDGLITSMVLEKVEIGCDPFRDALRLAARTGIYGRLEAAPVEEISIKSGSVATVVCNSVLEHAAVLDPVLSTVKRVLRPGGRFVFCTPTDQFSRWLALPVKTYGSWRNRHLSHVNLWPAQMWAQRLNLMSLTIESVRPYMTRPLVFLWDVVDLLERVWVAGHRLVGVIWKRLPPALLSKLSRAASRIDLSAPFPGGGHVIVARKSGS